MKKTSMLVALAGLALTGSAALGQVFSASANLPILDESTTSSTISVTSGPASVQDLNVNVQLTHTWDSDVDMVLQGPSGFVTLSTDNGDIDPNYFTTRFDDVALDSITSGFAPFNGNFRPETTFNDWGGTPGIFFGNEYASLSGFNGASADGDWTLWVADDAFGDTGTLLYWSLEFNFAADPNNPNPPPAAPTAPGGNGTFSGNAVIPGNALYFQVTAIPATTPPSTGLSVSVDGAPLGLGTFSLLDDGINDDGIAGNNIFGRTQTVNAASGSYIINYTVSDAQNRSSIRPFPALSVIGCPAFNQPQSFANLSSFGSLGDPNNSIQTFNFTGDDVVTELHVSGLLTSGSPFSWASEATLSINFADGSSEDFQIFDQNGPFTSISTLDTTLPLTRARRASEIVSFETYDSFDDSGLDASWDAICIAYNVTQTNPAIISRSATPATAAPGDNILFLADVVPGANPFSTNLNVTLDASQLNGGTLTMVDDGISDDGTAGNGTYGARFIVPGTLTAGTYLVDINASDAEGRSANLSQILVRVNVPAQWDETAQGGGDAGELPDTAQTVAGSGALTSIGGAIVQTDVDMYLINICDPANFSASTLNSPGTLTDTQLRLFRTDGTGVEANDDFSATNLRARLDNSFVSEPGNYLLAISGFNRFPIDSDGSQLWNFAPFNVVRAPDGPGALSTVAGWSGFNSAGTYQIAFTGTCLVGAPICDPDLNQDGNADQGDVDYIINVIAGGDNPTNIDPDFNQDGNSDQGDIDALVNVIAGGECP